jgi:hypothetical protein
MNRPVVVHAHRGRHRRIRLAVGTPAFYLARFARTIRERKWRRSQTGKGGRGEDGDDEDRGSRKGGRGDGHLFFVLLVESLSWLFAALPAHPCSLLQYVVRACAGCLLGLCGGSVGDGPQLRTKTVGIGRKTRKLFSTFTFEIRKRGWTLSIREAADHQ